MPPKQHNVSIFQNVRDFQNIQNFGAKVSCIFWGFTTFSTFFFHILKNSKEKAATFNNNKAIKFLKENGQVNYSIIEVEDDEWVKAIIVWEYKDKESREKCQEYWNKWFEFDDD